MRHWRAIAAIGLAVALLAAPASARRHGHRARRGQAGTFDYYVLSLSWSPQHCAGHESGPDDPQCGAQRTYGFVVHGLWPQYESGFPQSCAANTAPDQKLVESMVDIMPSPQLVRHEWSAHGTCSGMPPPNYFATVRAASSAVKIPAPYVNPSNVRRVALSQIKQDFEHVNPGVEGMDLVVVCSGKFLQEVRVCLDKDLHPRACGRDIRDGCRGDVVTVRPVR